MVFSRVSSVVGFLLLKFLLVNAQIKIINLQGRYTCTLHPSNQLWLELRAWDNYGHATRMNAINAQEEEITECPITGSGVLTSPFYMTTKIRMTDDVEVFNSCGMTKTIENGNDVYNWRVKAYTYPLGYYADNVGFILSLRCDTSDITDGRVETLVNIDIPRFTVYAADPTDVTGLGSIATDANIIYSANLYLNGHSVPDELNNAKGFYFYNCYSANNAQMIDEERFIDEKGCPISGATYAPTSGFRSVTNTGDYLKIEASFAKANLIGDERDIYVTCLVGKCIEINDPHCEDICLATTNNLQPDSRVNTGVIYDTSFTIEDKVAHKLTPTSPTDSSVVLQTLNVGDSFTIYAYNSPGGIDGRSDLLDAKGFYVYNCNYATNEQMNDPTQFIDNFGCRILNTKMTPASDFAIDEALTSGEGSKYVTKSGSIVIQSVGNTRYWVQCYVGKCTVEDHNYCKKRCGATNNFIGGATDLNYRGHKFTLSVLDLTNEAAVQTKLQTPNGETISSTSGGVYAGDNINFSVEVTPGGTGAGAASFSNAKGIFLHSCYATIDGGQQEQFIDEAGCPVPDSRFRTSDNCVDATVEDGVPPFKINCGTINVPDDGDITTTCRIMSCLDAKNAVCENRCGAGNIQSNPSVVDPGVSTATGFTAEERARTTDRRTAVRSEEIRTIIGAMCAVLGFLFLLLVLLFTFCVIRKQKRLAKRRLDDRNYNY